MRNLALCSQVRYVWSKNPIFANIACRPILTWDSSMSDWSTTGVWARICSMTSPSYPTWDQSSWNFLLFLQTKFVVVKFFLIISSFNLFWWLVICMGVTCHSYSTFKSYSCQNPNHNVGWGLTQLSLHTRTLLLPERMILGVWNFVLGALNLELPTKIIQSIFFDNVVRTPTTTSTQTNLTSKSWVRSENDFQHHCQLNSLCCCCSWDQISFSTGPSRTTSRTTTRQGHRQGRF